MKPISIHPDNNKVLLFRGKPTLLLCATEHYGAVMNRPFDFDAYLEDCKDKCQNYTRLFLLFREQQSAINPYSTCKPESPDYISPFPRVGPGKARDGEPVYDVSQWNPEFFDRLHRFIKKASDYGVVVEVVIFSNTYGDSVWDLNPLHAANNINDLEDIHWTDYITLKHPKRNAVQERFVRKVVTELNGYDNVIFELCNEPGGQVGPEYATVDDVNAWLCWVSGLISETEKELPNKHLIVGQEAFCYNPMTLLTTLTHQADFPVDVVNVHPLPDVVLHDRAYDLGTFMSKQLKLSEVRDYCLAAYQEKKPLNFDEDNVASCYKDAEAWTIHRKRAWTTLMNLSHYDVIDFSIIIYSPTGTTDSRAHIRSWFKYLAQFVAALPLDKARVFEPQGCWKGDGAVLSGFKIDNAQYVYIADDTELVFAQTPSYQPICGTLTLDLAPGEYHLRAYSPLTGGYSPAIRLQGDVGTVIDLLPFEHDVVVCVTPVV